MQGGSRETSRRECSIDLRANRDAISLRSCAAVLEAGDRRAQLCESGLTVKGTHDIRQPIRLSGRVSPPRTGAHDDKAGPPQMVGQSLCRERRRELPAAAARLAALVIPQCIGQSLGNLLRCCGGEGRTRQEGVRALRT